MEKEKQILIKQAPYDLNELYHKYAGMLLGYINGIVNDRGIAEQHLVNIYSALPAGLNYTDGTNTWLQLQRIARTHLTGLHDGVKKETKIDGVDLVPKNNRNKFLNQMTPEQRDVFCKIYYHGKTAGQLSKELKISEDSIRQCLKQAFSIIKKAS